ncbi:MAG: hypothetical protein LBU95_03940 [Rikenellaceae bacterium]|jgi:beta-galactosidase|nr:hypothetical protein [Rikenellaceae bacterium]
MKYLLAIFLLFSGAVCGQGIDPGDKPWENPAVTGIGKELPRTQLTPYASQADAIARTPGTTAYVRMMEDEWSFADGGFTSAFIMPFAWIDRQMFLRVPSIQGPYVVTVNDTAVGYSQDGRSPVEFDITKIAKEGRNTVRITVIDGAPSAKTLENYKKPVAIPVPAGVCVVAQPRIRVREIVYSSSFTDGDGYLQLGVAVKSHLLNVKQVRVHYELLAPDGKSVATSYRDSKFEMRDEDTVRFFERVPAVKMWSPAEPSLYTLVVKSQAEGRYTEYVAAKIGFRTLEVEGGKIIINGTDARLNVVEFTPTGDLAKDEAQVQTLKRTGANTLKLLPCPQSEAFYAMCDRLGVYLIDQANVDTHAAGDSRKLGGNPSNDPAWTAAFVDRAVTMYRCSQLHPSVILYSLAANSANGFCLYESYRALKALDTGRPVIYLQNAREWNSDAVSLSAGALRMK